MSLPATEYWFSISVRRNRKSYILASLTLFGISAAVVTALIFFDVGKRAGFAILILFGLPILFVSYCLAAQRLRDFGVSGWLMLVLVPISMLQDSHPEISGALSLSFWIMLAVMPGTKGPNRYGPDPLGEA